MRGHLPGRLQHQGGGPGHARGHDDPDVPGVGHRQTAGGGQRLHLARRRVAAQQEPEQLTAGAGPGGDVAAAALQLQGERRAGPLQRGGDEVALRRARVADHERGPGHAVDHHRRAVAAGGEQVVGGHVVRSGGREGPAVRGGDREGPAVRVDQQHRGVHQGGQRVQQLPEVRPAEQRLRQRAGHLVGVPELHDRPVDDRGVDRLGDLGERHPGVQGDQRQPGVARLRQHVRRHGVEGPAQLERERRQARVGHGAHVGPAVLLPRAGQAQTGGEQQLPTAQQRGHLVHLGGVDPPHLAALRHRPGEDLGPGAQEHLVREHVDQQQRQLTLRPLDGRRISACRPL